MSNCMVEAPVSDCSGDRTLITSHPRGFYSSQTEMMPHKSRHGYIDSNYADGDKQVDELFTKYMSDSSVIHSYEFRRDVLAAAIRLIGKMRLWIKIQEKMVDGSGYRYEFLADTLSYLKTGHRRMAIVSQIPLLDGPLSYNRNEVRSQAGTAKSKELSNLFDQLGLSEDPYAYLTEWCFKPNGLGDLISTLYVLFGKSATRF